MATGRVDLVDVDVTLVHETELAYLVTTDGDAEVWVPKSRCEYDPDAKQLTLKRSYAVEKGLV